MSDLSNYISHVLSQIVVGVSDAQTEVEKFSAKVNPTGLNISESGKETLIKTMDGNLASFVDFDISLIVENTTSEEGGLNLSILKIGANAKLSDSDKQSNTHKVKFRVPILLPAHEDTVKTNK